MNVSPLAKVSAPTAGVAKLPFMRMPENKSGDSFGGVLTNAVADTNQRLSAADQAIQDLESGNTTDINSVVSASVKADLSFRFMLELRNRLTASFQELSRMQF